MSYTDSQIEYALGVVLDCAGDCKKAQDRLDREHLNEDIDFNVPAVMLTRWKNREHAALYRRLQAQVREQHMASVMARTQQAVNKAADALEDAVDKAVGDMERTSGRDAALVADKLSQVAERGTKLMATLSGQETDQQARIIDDAMEAIERNVAEGWLTVAQPIMAVVGTTESDDAPAA